MAAQRVLVRDDPLAQSRVDVLRKRAYELAVAHTNRRAGGSQLLQDRFGGGEAIARDADQESGFGPAIAFLSKRAVGPRPSPVTPWQ